MIDLHNDALLELPVRKLFPYLRRAKAAGVDEIWLSVWTTQLKNPLKTIADKQQILAQIAGMPEYPLCRLHIEDLWFLTPENINELLAIHPHSVGLTWNQANHLAGGAHSHSGITPFGYQVIQTLETAGIQIDTAHLNRRSFWQFTKVTMRPLICTHTACNALHRHPRNLTNRQIKAIVTSGGLVGICCVPKFLTSNTTSCGIYHLLKHIFYFQKHFGTQSLCWGTDFYGTTQLPDGISDYKDLRYLFNAQIIGFSVMKQPLLAYQFGSSTAPRRLLITGGIHAREWITTKVVQNLMPLYQDLPSDVSVVYIPNCNPDGTRLATTGLTPFFKGRRRFLRRINSGFQDFSLWKANARAVDLNVNFDAGWGHGQSNITVPAPANYIGRRPHSEPETQALVKFISHYQPTISLAFHSKGEIVYYSRADDQDTATKLAALVQYQAIQSQNSYGGLTDYLALKLGIPAFTIEVGNDNLSHPLTTRQLPTIMRQVTKIFYFFTGA